MYFESLRSERGCMSYLVGCDRSGSALVIDPSDDLAERYLALCASRGLRLKYLVDTHTHADHFSALRELSDQLGVPGVMHRASPAPFVELRVDDGETLIVGDLRFSILHTPGHTRDSMCLAVEDKVFTGDTLLLGSVGRTDLPSGDPEALYDSLFGRLFALDDSLLVHPAHNYKDLPATTLAEQRATNARLQKGDRAAFVEQMQKLDLGLPDHLTEALRTNTSGGRTVDQIIQEAAERVSFMTMNELRRRIDAGDTEVAIVDVREADAYAEGHIPGAIHLPRGQLELRVDRTFPDPTVRILAYCELGKISTIAAGTLHNMGFTSAIALDGGMQAWREAGHPVETGS